MKVKRNCQSFIPSSIFAATILVLYCILAITVMNVDDGSQTRSKIVIYGSNFHLLRRLTDNKLVTEVTEAFSGQLSDVVTQSNMFSKQYDLQTDNVIYAEELPSSNGNNLLVNHQEGNESVDSYYTHSNNNKWRHKPNLHNKYKDLSKSKYNKYVKGHHTRSYKGGKVRRQLSVKLNATNQTMRRFPNAIIIGVKKCGTRALLEYLRLHPDVRATGPEPHFFDRFYHLGLGWYRKKMPLSTKGQITIEKTPRYFVTKEAPERLYNMSRDVKLIIIVRDPVTRAISDFTQASSKGPGPATVTFRSKAFRNNGTEINIRWSPIATGIYAEHVRRWRRYFLHQNMLFVSGENLISNPSTEVEKVETFLGIRHFIQEQHFYFNKTKGFPCIRKLTGNRETRCFNRSKGRPHSYVDNESLIRLREFYKPFNKEFYDLIGRNFGW